jgi:hypothetical protein
MIRILITGLLLIFTLSCVAQLSRNRVEMLLTNSKSRTWQFKEYKKTLGSECTGNGQLFIFYKGGKLQRVRCVNGKREFKELTWKIVPTTKAGSGEWQLELSQSVEFENGGSIQVMRIELPLGEANKKGKTMNWKDVPECKQCIGQTIILKSTN